MSRGMHKPKSLEKRRELFDQSGLNGKSGFKRPGSLKK